jgi:hypothetical protein
MNHTESGQGRTSGVNVAGESIQAGYGRAGQLEKEDFVVLFLSIILIVATMWLAAKVL